MSWGSCWQPPLSVLVAIPGGVNLATKSLALPTFHRSSVEPFFTNMVSTVRYKQ